MKIEVVVQFSLMACVSVRRTLIYTKTSWFNRITNVFGNLLEIVFLIQNTKETPNNERK